MAEAEKPIFQIGSKHKKRKNVTANYARRMQCDTYKNPITPSENEIQVHHDAYPTHPSITCPKVPQKLVADHGRADSTPGKNFTGLPNRGRVRV
jgi:hypothetical protein